MKFMHAFLFTSLFLLISCESTSSNGGGSGGYDSRLTGTWIEVKGMQGPDYQDTISFSSTVINLGTISTLPKFAENGQIWEDFGGDRLYKYAYQVIGDTLWMDAYDIMEDSKSKSMNPLWANAFVKLQSYTPPPTVDPDLLGNWIEAVNDSYHDSLVVTSAQFEFHKARSDLFAPILYGVAGPVFVKEGVIGETLNGVNEISYAYRLVGDTLLLDPCSSFCSEFSSGFMPGQKYVRLF